jgi:hypothetical protein
MVELEMTRSLLRATDATEQQGRPGTEGNAIMTAGKITPRPAFRLLTLILLILALADRVPAVGVWWIVASGLTALVLAGMLAAWIGLAGVRGRAAMGSRSNGPLLELSSWCRHVARLRE